MSDEAKPEPAVHDVMGEVDKGTAAAQPVLVVSTAANRSPAQIEADIDRTRERLSATLDELSERLTPANLARAGGRSVKAQFVDPETGTVRTGRVAAVAGAAAALVAAVVTLRGLRDKG